MELERPHTAKALPIPGYVQSDAHTCGFIAAMSICTYFGKLIEPRLVYHTIRCRVSGTSQTDLIKGLRLMGISASQRYDMTPDKLRRAIDDGKPVIVYHELEDHWEVLYGYDIYDKYWLTADGGPRCRVAWASYEHYYASSYGIVCSSKG